LLGSFRRVTKFVKSKSVGN